MANTSELSQRLRTQVKNWKLIELCCERLQLEGNCGCALTCGWTLCRVQHIQVYATGKQKTAQSLLPNREVIGFFRALRAYNLRESTRLNYNISWLVRVGYWAMIGLTACLTLILIGSIRQLFMYKQLFLTHHPPRNLFVAAFPCF